MKRTSKKNIQLLRNVISTFSGDIPRKTVVNLAIKNGLIEKDTYPLIKPIARGNDRGTYNVDKMLSLADAILNKGKKTILKVVKENSNEKVLVLNMPKTNAEIVTEKLSKNDSVNQINDMFDQILEEEKFIDSVSQPKGKCYGYEPIAPNEDDISDELSLMGTCL